ncbi:MAG: asparagine synthase-related protein [Candidatus Aminicenantes bacterium]|nr:asparagine synthase-related protein [Candidatus Aminicenantes bacterium]
MSALFGIFYRDGRKVERETLEKMWKSMEYWGPDGGDVWCEGPIGLGHLNLNNTPESLADKLPKKSKSGNIILTAHARIDNRKELLEKFNVPSSERATLPDSSLIILAFEQWGEECVHHLIGDWVFAAWDRRERKLFLARDHYGNTGLYYHVSGKFVAFSSCIKGLLCLDEIPKRLNKFRIAQIVTASTGYTDESVYCGIKRLVPAHRMTIDSDKTRLSRYWKMEDAKPLKLPNENEYIEAFKEVFSEAVRCRLRSHKPVAVTLSGGLDSGSVAVFAARELRSQGKRLKAFTSVPVFETERLVGKNRFGDEWPYAAETARFAENIDLSPIPAEDSSILGAIFQSHYLLDEPQHSSVNMYWIHSLIKEVNEQGCGTLLTGQGGNATISWGGSGNLLHYIKRGQIYSLIKELIACSRCNNSSVFRIAISQILLPFFPFIESMMRGRFIESLRGYEPWQAYSALNKDYGKKIRLSSALRKLGHDPTLSRYGSRSDGRLRILRPMGSHLGNIWHEIGAGYQMEVRDPTLDKRVMEFCFSLPERMYRNGGVSRYLIRKSTEDLLPDIVRNNTHKGLQAADIGKRLRLQWTDLQKTLAEVEKTSLVRELIDIRKMRTILRRLEKNLNPKMTNDIGMILLRGMDSALFLAEFGKK